MTESAIKTASPLVQTLVARHQEPDWLGELRTKAWDVHEELPVPRLEKTDLTRRNWVVGSLAQTAQDTLQEDAKALLADVSDAAVVVVQDGFVHHVTVPETLTAKGVVFSDLHAAIQEHPELVKKHLNSVVTVEESKWAALNAAVWSEGAFVYVPRNVEVDVPLFFLHVNSGAADGVMPRVLVVAEEGSKCNFVELYLPSAQAANTVQSAVVEVVAKANAKVTVTSLTELVKGPTHLIVRRAQLERDASVDWVLGDVGDGFSVALVESVMKGPGSRSTTTGIGLGFGRQRLDLTASMIHAGHHSESEIQLHGVLRERANSLYRSSTHILEGAANASSEQSDRMLMLNGSARADAIPMLLIDENDVQRCGHAASVGQIDENQIYYLMSRGISHSDARRMIVWGYLRPTVDLIPIASVRDLFTRLIDRELV